MKLSLRPYFWLINHSILESDVAPDVDLMSNSVLLSPDQTEFFVSGRGILKMLYNMHNVTSHGISLPDGSQLKSGHSLAMYTYNWKQLQNSLHDCGFTVSESEKMMIVRSLQTLDFSIISDLVGALHQKAEESNSHRSGQLNEPATLPRRKHTNTKLVPIPTKSLNHGSRLSDYSKLLVSYLGPNVHDRSLDLKRLPNPAEDVVDFEKFAGDTEPGETTNCLEFLLTTLCRAMDLRPKQAAGLLTNNNKYLAVAVVKGFKGDFKPIINWYQEIYAESRHATGLVEKEERTQGSGSLHSMLNTLRVGFHSRNVEVTEQTCKVFSRLGQEFLEAELISKAWEWLVDPLRRNPGGPGFLSMIELLERENGLADSISQVLLQFGQFNLNELFSHHLVQVCRSPLQYLRVTQILFPALSSYKIAKDQILSSGLLQFWINFAIQKADNTSTRNGVNL